MKKEVKEWWTQTFTTMQAVGQELIRLHSMVLKNKLNGNDFKSIEKALNEMMDQIASPTENLPTA